MRKRTSFISNFVLNADKTQEERSRPIDNSTDKIIKKIRESRVRRKESRRQSELILPETKETTKETETAEEMSDLTLLPSTAPVISRVVVNPALLEAETPKEPAPEDSSGEVPKVRGNHTMKVPCSLARSELTPAHCTPGQTGGLFCNNCGWRMDLHPASSKEDPAVILARKYEQSEDRRAHKWKQKWLEMEKDLETVTQDMTTLANAVDHSLRANAMSPIALMLFSVLVTGLTVADKFYLAWKVLEACNTPDAQILLTAYNFIIARKRGENFYHSRAEKALVAAYPIMPGTKFGQDVEHRVFNTTRVERTESVTAGGPKGKLLPAKFPTGGGTEANVLAVNIAAGAVDEYVTGGETRLSILSDGQGGHYADATTLEPVLNELVHRVQLLESNGRVAIDYNEMGRVLAQYLRDARGSKSREMRNTAYEGGNSYNSGGRGRYGHNRGRGGNAQYVRGSGADEVQKDGKQAAPSLLSAIQGGQKPTRANF